MRAGRCALQDLEVEVAQGQAVPTGATRMCVRMFFRPLRGLGLFHFTYPRLRRGLKSIARYARCQSLCHLPAQIEFSRTHERSPYARPKGAGDTPAAPAMTSDRFTA